MEDNLRTALIVISVVVITAIFVHGFWTIRKNKNPYKLKAKPKNSKDSEMIEPVDRGFDGSGFDQDGVSKPRIIENPLKDEVSHQEVPMPAAADYEEQAASYQEVTHEDSEPTLGNIDDISQQSESDVPDLSAQDESLFEQVKAEAEEVLSIEETEKSEKLEKNVYQTPITLEKPVRKTVERPAKKAAIKRDQLEINFGSDDVKTAKKEPSIAQVPKPTVTPEVLIVSVVMPENQQISGAALLPTLLTLGMKFGDMNIFHRHQDNAGNGKVTFSLANIMNPGIFDLDNMESFTTQGVSLFMTLPNAGDAFVVFEQMLNAAKQLALEFNGQLLDDKRNVMTKQTEQHYTGKIREFERKTLIASA
jgi:cell division protein ZipA